MEIRDIKWRQVRHHWEIYLFAIPTFVLIGLFLYYPAASGVFHSFFRWNGADISEYVGLENYRSLVRSSEFWNSFKVALVLGCWNVVVGPSGFTSVDWESAREHGLPLWDLVYFLTDALATLAGAASPQAQDELSMELLRGDSCRSPFLFGWVERAVRDLQIPREAVGPLVTLGWLHHGLSHRTRATALRRAGGGEPALPGPAGRLASIWLTDPALGVDWRAWHGA